MPRGKNLPFGFDEGDEYRTIVLRYRLRDKCDTSLSKMARSVNVVWNYCNEAQRHAVQTKWAWTDKWLSGFQLCYQSAGVAAELGLHSHTVQEVCKQYAVSRQAKAKRWLRFRGRKSLAWVPFDGMCVTFDGAAFTFMGISFEPMHLREGVFHPASGFSGSFNQDSAGHWFINIRVDVRVGANPPSGEVGMDLGLETAAALSNGDAIAAPRLYRGSEAKLAEVQKARKVPKRVAKVHRKIANRRKDWQHQASAKIARENRLMVVGNVSSSKLTRTRCAKSVLDVGWSGLKGMLAYKAMMHGGRFIEVNESFTSQVCSECGALPASRPKGIANLGIREWQCEECGTLHNRDVNAARNILARGLASLAGGACHG